jgi:hypothetical protein
MKAASATVAAMSQGLTLGFQATDALTFGLSTCLTVGAAPAGDGDAGCNSDKKALLRFCLLIFCWPRKFSEFRRDRLAFE